MSNENKTALTAEEIRNNFFKERMGVEYHVHYRTNFYDGFLKGSEYTLLQTQEKDKEIERLEKLNVFDVAQLSDKIQSQQKEIEELNNLQQDMCSTIESLQSQLSEVTKERDECISWLTDLMYTSDMDSTQHNKLDKFIKSLTPTKE